MQGGCRGVAGGLQVVPRLLVWEDCLVLLIQPTGEPCMPSPCTQEGALSCCCQSPIPHPPCGPPARHVRRLVVDETDRLLRQRYQDWLPHVLEQLPGGAAAPQGMTRPLAGGAPLLPYSDDR